MATAKKATAAKKTATAKKSAAKKAATKPAAKKATAKKADTGTAVPVTPRPSKDIKAAMDKKANTMAANAPKVLSGRVVTESVDPNAERALRDPAVAADYNAAKKTLQELVRLEGRRTKVLKSLARQLCSLRAHFKQPGTRGRRPTDWNGESVEYQALANLLYVDVGLAGPEHESTKRAIRHHVEDVKRELVPAKDWDRYGIQALSRGQRQALASKSAKALEDVAETAEATAAQASAGQATGAQLVSLAKRIDAGISVYSTTSLRTLTPAQRTTFREQLEDTREKADAILRELDSLD